MNSWAMKFVNVTVTSGVLGAGSGVVMALCMSLADGRRYQMALVEGLSSVRAPIGMRLGWIAYYCIFKQRVKCDVFCAVTSVTVLTMAVGACSSNVVTDMGGWLSIVLAILVFLIASVRLKSA